MMGEASERIMRLFSDDHVEDMVQSYTAPVLAVHSRYGYMCMIKDSG
jgi:hypothetical protein